MKEATKIVTAGRDPAKNYGVVNPPVYHASTILSETVSEQRAKGIARSKGERGMTYGRNGTPTHFALEDAILALEGGDRCKLYSSGVGAIAAVLLAYVKTGDHILVVDSSYGPTRRISDQLLARFGVETTYYDPIIDPSDLRDLIRPNTKLVFAESPGSHTFEMQDIAGIADVAHEKGCVMVMDNTWASPLYFKPFEHGVDVSVQAGTKYIVGHSDVMIGTITAREEVWPALAEATADLGQTAGPDDVYLAQRGLRTIGVRMPRHWENGLKLAHWLHERPEVECVMHPALPDDPGHQIWQRDFLGASGLFGVSLQPTSSDALDAFIDQLELFGLGASWGGYESLVLITKPTRVARPWKGAGPTIRFHAGLEDPDDLIADLAAGFDAMVKAS